MTKPKVPRKIIKIFFFIAAIIIGQLWFMDFKFNISEVFLLFSSSSNTLCPVLYLFILQDQIQDHSEWHCTAPTSHTFINRHTAIQLASTKMSDFIKISLEILNLQPTKLQVVFIIYLLILQWLSIKLVKVTNTNVDISPIFKGREAKNYQYLWINTDWPTKVLTEEGKKKVEYFLSNFRIKLKEP